MNLRKLFSATMCAALISAFASSVFAVDKKDCYKQLQKIEADKFDSEQLGVTTPLIYDSYDSIIPIVRAYEKEGLLYEDIAIWFDKVRPEAKIALKTRFAQELSGDKPKNLLRWLRNYSVSYRMKGNPMSPKKWAALTPQQQLDYILSQDDIFSVINVRGRSEMFYTDLLYLKEGKRELAGFDFLLPSEITPDKLGVGNDLGSYEVKTSGGIVNQTEYLQSRKNTEDGLEGKVGHQHLVHGWPSNEKERIRIAPYYIETLDASTWAIFWYQAKRNPTYVESIVGHPYLGVYTRDSLNRLYKAMLNNDVSRFKNKFRMIGSRVMKADASIEGQNDQGDLIPDWEIRAGNKSMVRDDTESLLQARLMSGDYDGLLDYRSYKFDPSDSDEEIFKEFLSEEKIAEIKKFEENFPMMEHSDHALAHNHFRNKIIAPVLPWQNRLPLGEKVVSLKIAQKKYARKVFEIAEDFNKRYPRMKLADAKLDLREEALALLEKAVYRFSDEMRLDQDFDRYLTPAPKVLPKISLSKAFDVNKMDLGIEYSFRFDERIDNQKMADAHIKNAVNIFAKKMGGGKIQKMEEGGHGHGLSVRYTFTDKEGKIWRFEWDGILREYEDGVPIDPYGGHMEVPTPKFAPQDTHEIDMLYDSCREAGMTPKRSAGGSHVNFDLAQFMAMPKKVGARKMVNFINYFESNRELISFIWQHPSRQRVAIPVERTPEMEKALSEFHGDWNDLALLLYKQQYFNPYVGRKPRYIQFNVTSLITPVAPKIYRADLGNVVDIKNPEQKWFPEFGTGAGRVEMRLFDAMEDEYLAALQIKYVRAMMDHSLNSDGTIELRQMFSLEDVVYWRGDAKAFLAAAKTHLESLGLSYEEFRPLLDQSWKMQQYVPEAKEPLQKYTDFLPPVKP